LNQDSGLLASFKRLLPRFYLFSFRQSNEKQKFCVFIVNGFENEKKKKTKDLLLMVQIEKLIMVKCGS
jgi:hypothetical protein